MLKPLYAISTFNIFRQEVMGLMSFDNKIAVHVRRFSRLPWLRGIKETSFDRNVYIIAGNSAYDVFYVHNCQFSFFPTSVF